VSKREPRVDLHRGLATKANPTRRPRWLRGIEPSRVILINQSMRPTRRARGWKGDYSAYPGMARRPRHVTDPAVRERMARYRAHLPQKFVVR
jgi:hypothetical protein